MRVCIVPEYPLSLMTGGLQVQAVETYRALRELNGPCSADLFSWTQPDQYDLYHFIGFPRYLAHLIQLVRRAGKPYIITVLFGSDDSLLKIGLAGVLQRVNSQILRRRVRYDAVMGASRIVVITEMDATAARRVYGISRERIEVVPNGVSDGFFNASRSAWESQYGKESFALCVGAVQPRKNQLLLAQACNLLRRKLVLIGSTLPGERHYGELVRTAMLENRQHGGQWIESLKNDDPLLRSAYAACGVFALLSTSETQPLCVMEAMAAKARVLLLKMPYSKGKLFAGIETVKLANAAKTAEGLREVWDHGSATNLSSEYSWSAVASKLQKLYQQISTQYFSP